MSRWVALGLAVLALALASCAGPSSTPSSSVSARTPVGLPASTVVAAVERLGLTETGETDRNGEIQRNYAGDSGVVIVLGDPIIGVSMSGSMEHATVATALMQQFAPAALELFNARAASLAAGTFRDAGESQTWAADNLRLILEKNRYKSRNGFTLSLLPAEQLTPSG